MMPLYRRDTCETCKNFSCDHHGETYGSCHGTHVYRPFDWFELIEELQDDLKRAVQQWKASEIKISGARIRAADEIFAKLESLGGK